MAKIIDKMAWVYISSKHILSTRSKGMDVYYIPGGRREPGEMDHETLIREIKEELSVDLIPESIKFMGQFRAQAHGQPPGTVVQMTCYTADFKGVLMPDSEIEEIVWLTYRDRDKSSPVDQLIFDYLQEKGLLE